MTLETIQSAATTVAASHHWDGPGAWWPIFPLLWLVLVGTIIALFVVTGRRRSRSWGRRAGESRLAERYAAGEIDDDEYARRLAVLRRTDRT